MAGRSQIGIGDIQGPSFAFLNMMSMWAYNPTQSAVWPGLLKANQLPKDGTIAADITATMQFPTTDSGYAGQFRIKWTGTGGLKITQSNTQMTVISNTGTTFQNSTFTILSGTNVTAIVTFVAPHTSLTVSMPATTNGSTALTYASMDNLSFCRYDGTATDDATRLDNGEVFNPDYLDVLRLLNPKTVRTMDWSGCNITGNPSAWVPPVKYGYRTPTNAIGWVNSYFAGPNTWAGTITGTDAYTCPSFTDAPATWTHGMTWSGAFQNAPTGTTPTIAITGVSGGAAKSMVNCGGATFLATSAIKTDRPSSFVYDALLDKVLVGNSGIAPAVPVEWHVRLANDLGVSLWYNFPHMLDDTAVSTYAAYIRDNLTPSLSCYFEYSNEMWNSVFNCNTWASACGAAIGWPSGSNQQPNSWYGLRVRLVMALVTTAWSPRSTSTLKRVMGLQATASESPNQKKWKLEGFNLEGSTYPNYASAGYPNYNSSPNRPIDYCDSLSYATYYSGALFSSGVYTGFSAGDKTAMTGAADSYNGGDTATAFAWLDADIRYGTKNGTVSNATLYGFASIANGTGVYPAWETIAGTGGYPSLTVECYEGGMECVAPTTTQCTALSISTSYSAILASMLTAYKNSNYAQKLAFDQFQQFMGAYSNDAHYSSNGALPHSVAPSWFSLQGPNGAWSLGSGSIYLPNFKTFDGVMLFNNSKQRFLGTI